MATRRICNVITGEITEVDLTPQEEAYAAAALAAEQAERQSTAGVRRSTDATEHAAAKGAANVQTFLNFTPAELDAWCDANLPAGGTRVMGKVLGRLAQQAARGKALR